MDIKTLKERVCQAVEEHKEEIMALGDSIFQEPELGYKEYKTAAKVKAFIDEKIGMIVNITKNKIKGEIITNIGNCSLKEPSGAFF